MTESDLATVIVVLKTLILAMGGLVTLYAVRAYRRTRARSLRIFAIGFGTVTVGSLLAGVLDQFPPVDPEMILAVESAFTVVGFGAIVISLYVKDDVYRGH